MADDPIEIEIDNKAVNEKLLELAKRGENLRPLMKNIAGVFAYSTEENFKEEGRPDKWTDLAESTKNKDLKKENGPDRFYRLRVNSLHQLILLRLRFSSYRLKFRLCRNSSTWWQSRKKQKKKKFLQDHIYNLLMKIIMRFYILLKNT